MQQRRLEIPVDLGSEARDVDIDDVGLRVEVVVPYVFKQHGAGHDLTGMLHEIFKQAKLTGLQDNGLAGARHLVGEAIEHEVAYNEARAAFLGRFAPRQSLDASKQLAKGVGLGEVIVAT